MTKLIELCDNSLPRYEKIRGKRTWCLWIDKEKVVEQNHFYKEAVSISKTGKLLTKLDDVRFIFTKEIVSSAFFNVTGACLPMFTMNLHGFCHKVSEDMAGNYYTSLILNHPSYKSLYLNRRVLLQRPHRLARPIPLLGFYRKTQHSSSRCRDSRGPLKECHSPSSSSIVRIFCTYRSCRWRWKPTRRVTL